MSKSYTFFLINYVIDSAHSFFNSVQKKIIFQQRENFVFFKIKVQGSEFSFLDKNQTDLEIEDIHK